MERGAHGIVSLVEHVGKGLSGSGEVKPTGRRVKADRITGRCAADGGIAVTTGTTNRNSCVDQGTQFSAVINIVLVDDRIAEHDLGSIERTTMSYNFV